MGALRSVPGDISASIVIAITAALAVFLLPDGNIGRWVLGIPLLFFLPGWMLVQTVWPENGGSGTSSPILEERLALAVGLSIAIDVLVAFILNYTSGMGALSSVGTLTAATIALGCMAVIRRRGLDSESRFDFTRSISRLLTGGDKASEGVHVAAYLPIAVCAIFCALAVGLVLLAPQDGGEYSEFYLQDTDGGVEGLPSNITVNQTAYVTLGITNHEGADAEYEIIVSIGNWTGEAQQGSWSQPITLDMGSATSLSLDVDEGSTSEEAVGLRFMDEGTYKVSFTFIVDGVEQEPPLHIWIEVH